MKLFNTLERIFDRYSISNITYYLLGGQIISYLFIYLRPEYAHLFLFRGELLLQGEWWRIFTFLVAPVESSPIFAIFVWYLFYLYGTALERQWGSFRYVAYLLISYIGTLFTGLLFPSLTLTNVYLYISLFLAFSYLHPEMKVYLFFIIPVKMKWLGIIAWIGIGISFLFGSLTTKIITLVSISNFLIFFWNDLVLLLRYNAKHMSSQSKKIMPKKPYHICAVCGRNESDGTDMSILYCNECTPSTCYCENHISHHTHKGIRRKLLN